MFVCPRSNSCHPTPTVQPLPEASPVDSVGTRIPRLSWLHELACLGRTHFFFAGIALRSISSSTTSGLIHSLTTEHSNWVGFYSGICGPFSWSVHLSIRTVRKTASFCHEALARISSTPTSRARTPCALLNDSAVNLQMKDIFGETTSGGNRGEAITEENTVIVTGANVEPRTVRLAVPQSSREIVVATSARVGRAARATVSSVTPPPGRQCRLHCCAVEHLRIHSLRLLIHSSWRPTSEELGSGTTVGAAGLLTWHESPASSHSDRGRKTTNGEV